jgi:hypothetical protein
MVIVTISYSPADGVLVNGDPRPHQQALQDNGFRWFRSLRCWGMPGTRDRHLSATRRWRIDQAARALRDAGLEVVLDLDETAQLPPTAEREEQAGVRAEDRQERLDDLADRLDGQAEARLRAAREEADLIPMGQPILVGHHSERRHRRALDRIDRNMRQGIALDREANRTATAADASRARQALRESGPATMRRIEELEAEARRVDRNLTPCETSSRRMKPEAEGRTITCPRCYNEVTITGLLVPQHGSATGQHAEQLQVRRREIDDELAYWRAHLEHLKGSGEFRQYGPSDFHKDDRVHVGTDWGTVVRVNRKSLTVLADVWAYCNNSYPVGYDKVRAVQCPHQPEAEAEPVDEDGAA